MVNRINGNDSYDYTQLKMPTAADTAANTGEKFSLAYQRAQDETDEKDKNDKSEEAGAATADRPHTVVQGGVKLELSGSGQGNAGVKRDSSMQSVSVGNGLVDTIKNWIASFIQSAKELLYRIWNDPVSTEDVIVEDAESAATDEPEKLSEEYLALNNLERLQNPEEAAKQQIEREAKKDAEIQKLLRSGDMEQVISLVTENGQKTMAKNSTLLTYYDRTGKITPLNASDQERILHGDKSVRKL